MTIDNRRLKAAGKLFSVILALMMSIPLSFTPSGAKESPEQSNTGSRAGVINRDRYGEYLDKAPDKSAPVREITISGSNFTSYSGAAPQAGNDALHIPEESGVSWEFEVPQAGLYNLLIRYRAANTGGKSIQRELRINEEIPFDEMRFVSFGRIWADSESFRNPDGNEVRPVLSEKQIFTEMYITGTGLNSDTTYQFYFKQGFNTITLNDVSGPLEIEYIKLLQKPAIKTYGQYCEENGQISGTPAEPIKIQAELTTLKSEPFIVPLSDMSSPANEPSSIRDVKLNTIGSTNWSAPKQWITYVIDVPADGVYTFGMRVKKSDQSGASVNKMLLIDGEVPFEEAANISIKYNRGWQMYTLGGKTPYHFYLTAGPHTVTLRNMVGALSPVLQRLNGVLAQTNDMYRQIRMLVGSIPDANRDYSIEVKLPDSVKVFAWAEQELYGLLDDLESLTGGRGESYGKIQAFAVQIGKLSRSPGLIPAGLDSLRANISDLSGWMMQSLQQPAIFDYFIFNPAGQPMPKADANVFARLSYGVKRFFLSFGGDYSTTAGGSKEKRALTVWMGSGRDQAASVRVLTENYFTPGSGIAADVKLVDMTVLLPATAAGMGPDLAIGQDRATPMNYAYRGALYNLANFSDFADIKDRFFSESLTAFSYRDTVYALPETFDFSMMFYRKDVLGQLGLQPPGTWDELQGIMPRLTNHNLSVGLPPLSEDNIELFLNLLYQNGGAVYDDSITCAALDSETAIDSFSKWTDFYTKYGAQQKMDFLTRFRTGESPIIIAPYTFFNTVTATAPEINGLWDFTILPGTKGPDGTVVRHSYGTGTGAVVFSNARNKDTAWEFLKWWTESETQRQYNQEMESVLGPSARIATANKETLTKMPWGYGSLQNIIGQSRYAKGLPEAPGGYLTARYLGMAARLVINNGIIPRDALVGYTKEINDEMAFMRKEFDLDREKTR